MGRRATSTTKGGRFMNPADQERKQARKRELKKNKKQRIMVRQAVLKSKDATDILDQMRRLDAMEFDPDNPPPLAEKVILEKRAKLRETYNRVMAMYKREEEEDKFQEMKKDLFDYDRLRAHLEQNFRAIKFAKEANPAEIPLPDGMFDPDLAMTPAVPKIPLPPGVFPPHMMLPEFSGSQAVHGILKKGSGVIRSGSDGPPGPPCGVPPILTDTESEDDSDDDDEMREARLERKKDKGRVRFDAPEEEEKDSRTKFKELARRIAAGEKIPLPDDKPEDEEEEAFDKRALPSYAGPASLIPGVNPLIPPGARLLRPPPPPPGAPPPRMGYPPLRIPLPPGALPPGVRLPRMPQPGNAVISAGPSISKSVGPIIEAKPQLRNMQAEVTKLVPVAVRVRREGQTQTKKHRPTHIPQGVSNESGSKNPTKDDAYELFMNEMQGLL